MTVYVARDNSGDLFMYQTRPDFGDGEFWVSEGDCWALDKELFPAVSPGECMECSITPSGVVTTC